MLNQGVVPIKPDLRRAPRSQVVHQLAQQSVTRLHLASLGFAAMFLLSELLVQISLRFGHQSTLLPLYSNGLGLILSIIYFRLSRQGRLPLSRQVLLGEAYLVSLALAMSLGEASEGLLGNQHGLSRLVLVVLIIPLLLPSGPRRALIIAALCLLTQPFSQLILRFWGFPGWSVEQSLVVFLADVLAIGAVTLPAQAVAELNQKALESYELGQYRLLNRLAEGGMGEIWLAQHKMLGLTAAVKLMKVGANSPLEEQERCARFRLEARSLAELKSPHTVRVLDFGEDANGTLYLAMERLEGLDLDRLVRQYGILPWRRVVHILCQTCLSLEEAHENEIIHRDIKPGNLFLTHQSSQGDCAKVLDFGLARLRTAQPGAVTGPDVILGTPEFMAPEVGRGDIADARSDLYSLGCLAFWMLVGQDVFPCKTYLKTMLAHQQTNPPRPSWRTDQEIPKELDLIVERCLRKKPEDRPQTAKELLHSLQSIPNVTPWSQQEAQAWWEGHNAKQGLVNS